MATRKTIAIEDLHAGRHAMAETQAAQDHEAMFAETGIAKAKSELPGLAMMNAAMSGMKGFQAAQEKARTPGACRISVIICTAIGQEPGKVWKVHQGARGCIVRPIGQALWPARLQY